VYCWTEPSGYLAACLRALGSREEIDCTAITWAPSPEAPFGASLLAGLNARTLGRHERNDYQLIRELVMAATPDVVVIPGWAHRPYCRLVSDRSFRNVKFILTADTPLRFDMRQLLARFVIGGLLDRADAIVVPGDRGYQLMRYWKVPESKIFRLLYAVDVEGLEAIGRRRSEQAYWPNEFLFIGRLVPTKGVDVLMRAYRKYRDRVMDPWPLTIAGVGPLEQIVRDCPGAHHAGFVQPSDIPALYEKAGVFVLPSRHDAWGQVIVEAAAAHLPIICTTTCGASVELVRHHYNGALIPPADEAALLASLRWAHQNAAKLPVMGLASAQFAKPYSVQRWADNQVELATALLGR